MASFEKRGKTVRAIVRVAGGGKKTATFDTLGEARAWAREVERKKAAGRLGGADGVTVGDMLECYLDDVASKTDSARWNRIRVLMFQRDPLALAPLADVITHDINQWMARRLATPSPRTGKPVSPATVNRELNLLSAAFSYAIRARKWITENPCHGANRPAAGPGRDRRLLTADEIRALCAATGYREDDPLTLLGPRVGACFLLALETGMRSGEMLRLRPADYNRDDRTLFVSASEKGGRKGARSGRVAASRTVPLTARAVALVDQLLQSIPAGQPYIVGMTDAQRDANWRKYRDMAGVENLHFHDAKHEAATRLCKFLDVIALSHAIGTKDLKLLRDTYYNNDAKQAATLLPERLAVHA